MLAENDALTAVFDWGCAGLGDFLYELAMFTFYAPWFPAMESIDWAESAKAHYKETDLQVENFNHRLKCYEVHLGLTGMAYSSFTKMSKS